MADSKFKDIGEGIAGAGLITAALLTPFLRFWHWWDTTDAEVHRSLPGDDLVPHSKGGTPTSSPSTLPLLGLAVAGAAGTGPGWILQLRMAREPS